MSRRRSRLLGAARGKFGYLLLALLALLLSAPVMAEGWAWRVLILVFVAGVLVAGLYAVRPGRHSLIAGLVVAAVEFAIGRLAVAYHAHWLILVQIVLWMVALLYVTVAILDWVLDSPEVTLETLQAAFCVYLLLGLLWAYLYALMEVTSPESFRVLRGPAPVWTDERSRRLEFTRLFIFSYATLTGTGQGDLEPATGFADMAAALEAMSAQVYLAVVIARLVGLQASAPPPGAPRGSVR
jgi:hypothetical protein